MAGRHFDRKLLRLGAYTKPEGSIVTDCTLIRAAMTATANANKALALVPKLSFMIQVNDKGMIVGYTSGCNESDFIRKIRGGMYYMLKMGDGPEFKQGPAVSGTTTTKVESTTATV